MPGVSKFLPHSVNRVILSPHPDDAVLSLGACIPVWRREASRVRIVTVFDGPPRGELTPAARQDRERYVGDPVAIRKAEDLLATSFLDAELLSLNLPELVYRYRPDGSPRCVSLEDIFGPLEADDDAVVAEVADALNNLDSHNAVLHVPLGTGGHCDHRIVRKAAERVFIPEKLHYYDDMPYAMREQTHDPLIVWPKVTDEDIERWIEATSMYESQMLPLFENEPNWQAAFRKWSKLKRVN